MRQQNQHQAPEWLAQVLDHHRHVARALDGAARAIEKMTPSVIGAQSVTLDANGQATGQYHVPYACLFIDSQSAKLLTIANQPLNEAPGTGPGIGFVRIGGVSVWNAKGYAWSIYGGNAGEIVTVTAYANPQPPYAK